MIRCEKTLSGKEIKVKSGARVTLWRWMHRDRIWVNAGEELAGFDAEEALSRLLPWSGLLPGESCRYHRQDRLRL